MKIKTSDLTSFYLSELVKSKPLEEVEEALLKFNTLKILI